jgi:pimeloyl-ACP methyl ester carboxylesterase
MKPWRIGHVPINGLSLYHEVYGELGTSKTAPLLLIPGAHMATDSMEPWVSAFAGTRTVIVFDQQGRDRKPDTSCELSYRSSPTMPRRCCALKVERADVMGYLQGGGVALQLALRHPTLVNKLVRLSSANLRSKTRACHQGRSTRRRLASTAETRGPANEQASATKAVSIRTARLVLRRFGSPTPGCWPATAWRCARACPRRTRP